MNDSSYDDKTKTHVVLAKGATVAHYKIIEKIGAGGMGEVYLAEDTKLNRKVALKFLSPLLCQDKDCRARFKREAQAAARLDHPNVVTIHEVGEFQNRPYFAMQHVTGQSLKDVVKGNDLSLDRIVDLVVQICEGLSKAHQSDIVHRDVKPSNVVIDADGRPKLLDFGLAAIKDTDQLTKTGSTLGTIGYMSPEQVRGKDTDHRSDLFSLGIVLYEMIAGRLPFKGDTEAATMNSVLNEAPEPLSRYKSGVSDKLQDIVSKLLEKDPSLRYQSAAGVISDLKRLAVSDSKKEVLRPSIAVLPFTNLSTDPDQEYFCDGMAEEIINALTKIDTLRVVARTSCFAFKGKHEDIRTIGDKLNVSAILEGSVRKSGNRLRITAQLINVADGYHLWSEKYDRNMEDIFAIQDEISLTIVDKLKVKLLKGKRASLTKRYTDNIEAYNLYLKGRFYWNKRVSAELEKAKDLFEKVLALDPNYALAYAGLADCFSMLGQNLDIPPRDAFPKAREMALKALSIDGTLAEAHTSLAGVLATYDWNWKEAENEFNKAIELNPNYATAHQWYGLLLIDVGRLDEAINETKKAQELDPLSPILGVASAWTLIAARRYEEAEKICYQLIDDDSNFMPPHFVLGSIYEATGEYDKAATKYLKGLSNFGYFRNDEYEVLSKSLQLSGWKGYCQKLIDILKQRDPSQASADIALNYFRLGEIDLAFEWLNKAYNEKDPNFLFVRGNVHLDTVRSDPRYLSLMKKIGLE